MSLRDAIQMMGTTVNVAVESDVALAGRVAQRQRTYVAGTALPHKPAITPAIGLNGNIQLRPISAMLELARGTALNDDPEIAAFARRWSILRHLGVFAMNPATGALHLDDGALQYIGPNQRRVLSEDLGIGFGIVAAKHWCRERAIANGNTTPIGPITAIDVDKALNNGVVPNLRRAGPRQPDYLLSYSDPANLGTMIYDLLETKGSVSRSTAVNQLGRAATQLAGLTVGGRTMTGLAASTVSNADGVLVMAIDPEEPKVSWNRTKSALERWRTNEVRSRKDDLKLDVPLEEFFATATNVDYATLAEFGGQHDVAKRWLPSFDAGRAADTNGEARRENDIGRFVGTEYVMSIPGTQSRIRLFQGVAEQVADGLRAVDASAVIGAQLEFAEGRNGETGMLTTPTEDTAIATAVSSDGSMLEISTY